MPYEMKKINAATTLIQGQKKESMYLLVGKHKALLIDTGMEAENLREQVSVLTDKPVVVALSHGHYDHIGRSGDFEEVHMNLRDAEMYRRHTHFPNNCMDMLHIKPVEEIKPLPESINLGGITVHVVPLKGHTPGSVLFVDINNKAVFTGDAIGSGCGCLMSIDGALNISAYKEGIEEAIVQLEKLGVTEEWDFWGGHDGQEYLSLVSEYNKLDLILLRDMCSLCGKLLDGTVIPIDSPKPKGGINKPYYAAYGKAEIDLDKSSIY